MSSLIAAGERSKRCSSHHMLRSRFAALLTVLCVLCALLTFCVGVAGAEVSRLIALGNFSSVEQTSGVAVDQSTGDVYVAGEKYGNFQGIEKFGVSGNVLSPPSPFGAGNGIYSGVAVNPTNGDVDVMGGSFLNETDEHWEPEIETYDPNSGALLSSFMVPYSGNGPYGIWSHAQIATDSAGNVYVPVPVTAFNQGVVPYNEVLEYDPGTCPAPPAPCTPVKTFAGSGASALSGATGVAVDPSGNVWVADRGNNRIEEFSPSGSPIGEIKSVGVESVAVDAHGDVFAVVINGEDTCTPLAVPCEHLVEYSASGAQIADVGAGSLLFAKKLEAFPPSSRGESKVAVDDATGRVYVTDEYNDVVWMFEPPVAPVLGQESSVEVGTSEAKLSALVNPGGAQTTYRFEYDTREYKPGEGPHGVSVPFPEGSVGEGISPRAVLASAKGLAPGTTYHYRAIVTNGLGTVVGPDETFTTETAAQVACPNESLRGGFSAALPDCRAYELVTSLSKGAGQPENRNADGHPDAADDGDRFSYGSTEVMPGSQSAGLEFIATRGAGQWTTQDLIPLQGYTGDRCTWVKKESEVLAYSAEMTMTVLFDNGENGGPERGSSHPGEKLEECRGEEPEVVSGEPLVAENLLLGNNETGNYQLINVTPPGVTPSTPRFVAASANLSVVLFEESAKLTPEAPSLTSNAKNLYEWRDGVVRLLRFALPSGAPVDGFFVTFSDDGSEMFFTAGGSLYVSLNGGERTVQVDEARGGSGPGGGGSFGAVTADGSRVFFTDEASAGLTSDTVPGSGTNLYSYDIDTGQLSDLTPFAHAEAGFTYIGGDGAYVYFGSESALPGAQPNQIDEIAESGRSNLYLEHNGTITFVAQYGANHLEEHFSSNGAFLVFKSVHSLTGYENNGAYEIYLYSAAANRFKCASCNPSGEPGEGAEIGNQPNSVSNDGQVFFETSAELLPRDTDGVENVYEYDYDSGLHLISSGTSFSESRLLAASPSGEDVFFLTRQALVSGEVSEEGTRVYDARVDGGFPETAVPPACGTADACRAASEPQPSIFGEPASQTFSGAGNVFPAPPTATVKAKALTRAQKLANALGTCRKDKSKSKRVKCEKAALKKYGAANKSTAKRSSDDRRASR